jgi:hypothetical protein
MQRRRTLLRPGDLRPRALSWGLPVSFALLATLWTLIPLAATQHSSPSAAAPNHRGSQQAVALNLVATSSTAAPTTVTAPAPSGDPTVTMTLPVDGSIVAAGTAVALSAALSPDLLTAVGAAPGANCFMTIGDDAESTVPGALDATTGVCSGTWTFRAGGAFSVVAWVETPAMITYASPGITVTVNGDSSPRCTGLSASPSGCVYRWAEISYIGSARSARVCAIDGGCLWQSAHTEWGQVAAHDYWLNQASAGQVLADGDSADAYLCVGSSAADWTSYTGSHDFTALLAKPETSADPVPAGTC